MKATWIIVADNTRARIFTASTPSSDLTEIEGIGHSEGRLHDTEITSDLPGRIKSSDGSGHALQQPTDPKQHEFDIFAHEIAKLLTDADKDKHADNRRTLIFRLAAPTLAGTCKETNHI